MAKDMGQRWAKMGLRQGIGAMAIVAIGLGGTMGGPAYAAHVQGLRVPPPPIGTLIEPRPARIGAEVLASVTAGRSIIGNVARQTADALWISPVMGPTSAISKFTVTTRTVIWQGRWRYFSGISVRHQAVNLVVNRHVVVGILEYENGYGRILRVRGRWVAIDPLINPTNMNPACATRHGRQLEAKITRDTVWNSTPGQLPPGSLVQFTVYGAPKFPVLLGGVEDYGAAPCSKPSPSASFTLGQALAE